MRHSSTSVPTGSSRRRLDARLNEPAHLMMNIEVQRAECASDLSRTPLTIFTIPKPFNGHIGVIQHNAIGSWTQLTPRPQIVLCGDEPGVAEAADRWGVQHLSDLARNEFGTPFLHLVFNRIRSMCQTDLLCYINADIILLNDFGAAVDSLGNEPCLMVGTRWDLDVREQIDFSTPDWSTQLRDFRENSAKEHSPWGIDYFVFPRNGVLDRLPPFVVGRPGWDNWVLYNARRNRVPVIDASEVVRVIHQNHNYDHVPMRSGDRWVGPESQRQIRLLYELMDGSEVRFAIVDATHHLTSKGIQPIRSLRSLRRRWETLPALHGRMTLPHKVFNPFVRCAETLWKIVRPVSN